MIDKKILLSLGIISTLMCGACVPHHIRHVHAPVYIAPQKPKHKHVYVAPPKPVYKPHHRPHSRPPVMVIIEKVRPRHHHR